MPTSRAPSRSLLVVAGEASGDLLAARALAALMRSAPAWRMWGICGPACRDLGVACYAPARDISVVGLAEVVRHLPRIVGIGRRVLARARQHLPDVALLVDLPDFNTRIGPRLHNLGVPVVYLGAPQAWAWRPGRANKMARWVDVLACLFPFEPAFFTSRGMPAEFVGHPRAFEQIRSGPRHGLVIMPGSRHSELQHHLPILREVIDRLHRLRPDLPITIPIAPTLSERDLRAPLGNPGHVAFYRGDAMSCLASAQLALVASGTTVTECITSETPAVVFYRLSPTTAAIGRRLIRTQHVAMANIMAGRSVVPELLQEDFTAQRAVDEVLTLLDSSERRLEMQQALGGLARALRSPTGRRPGELVADLVRGVALRRA